MLVKGSVWVKSTTTWRLTASQAKCYNFYHDLSDLFPGFWWLLRVFVVLTQLIRQIGRNAQTQFVLTCNRGVARFVWNNCVKNRKRKLNVNWMYSLYYLSQNVTKVVGCSLHDSDFETMWWGAGFSCCSILQALCLTCTNTFSNSVKFVPEIIGH